MRSMFSNPSLEDSPIAKLLAHSTVKTHLLHIFAKLGVDDRTAAVTEALDRGIIRLDRHRP